MFENAIVRKRRVKSLVILITVRLNEIELPLVTMSLL